MDRRHWPLYGLKITTPRVELRPPDETTMFELLDLASAGIHDPDLSPFLVPWTLEPDGERQRHSLQYHWRCWAEFSPERWQLPLAVRASGRLVGIQSVLAHDFPVCRTVETGSWLGRAHQGHGIGREMRAAVLHLAFEALGAERAQSGALVGNARSVAVSEALGYRRDGQEVRRRDDEAVRVQRFALEREAWLPTRRADIGVEGLAPCLPLFGLA